MPRPPTRRPVTRRALGSLALMGAALVGMGGNGCVGMSIANGSSALMSDVEPETNRLGKDYSSFDLAKPDPELCREACEKDDRCKAFTYVAPGWQGPSARCWLKDPVPEPSKHACCVSGLKW
jgi:hypothetical protein